MDRQPVGLVLELTSAMPAPPQRVFAALTEATAVRNWFGPRGFTMPEIDLSPHVGGGYRFTMQPPEGEAFHLSGEFLEIDAPHRLAYTFRYEEPGPDDRETTVRLSLVPVGDATEVSLQQGEFATEARLDLHRAGWTDSFDKLRTVVERRA